MKKDSVTDIQQARAIVKEVGEFYQHKVIDMLRGLTYYKKEFEFEKKAQKVIENMEHEYTLNTANALWADKYDYIPDRLKGDCDETI